MTLNFQTSTLNRPMRLRTPISFVIIRTLSVAALATLPTAVFAQAAAKSDAAPPAAKSDAAAAPAKSDAAAPDAGAAGTQANPKELLEKGDAALKAGDFNAAIAA